VPNENKNDKNNNSKENKVKKDKKDRSLTEKRAQLPAERRGRIAAASVERRKSALEKRLNPKRGNVYQPYQSRPEADEDSVKNERYEKVAKWLRAVKWACALLLIGYLLFMAFTFREEITMENFRYLIRNVDLDIQSSVVLENRIVYDADPDNMFIKYRDYLAVLGSGRLKIFDRQGGQAYSEEIALASPAAVTSDKYMILYDREGDGYSVYSYFALENREELGYPVSAAAISGSGTYAIAARSADYDGAVYVYNQSFKLINRVLKNKSVTALALTPEGDELIIAAYSASESGSMVTELTVLPTMTGSSRLMFSIEGVMPYECGYLSDGAFYLIGSDGVRIYENDGSQRARIPFDGDPISWTADAEGFALIYPDNAESGKLTCVMLDQYGGEIFRKDAGHGSLDIAKDGEYLLLLYDDRLIKTNGSATAEIEFETPVGAVAVVSGGGEALICTQTAAILPDFGE